MTSAERLERAGELLDEAVNEIEAALEEGVAHYCLDSLRFLRAEVRVAGRRLSNVRKVLGTTRKT